MSTCDSPAGDRELARLARPSGPKDRSEAPRDSSPPDFPRMLPENRSPYRRQRVVKAGVRPASGWRAAGEGMRNRRTAVLGGSGFIGRYVVKRLAARGEVVAVGCRSAEQAKFLKPMGDVGQVQPLNVAIDNEALLPAF